MKSTESIDSYEVQRAISFKFYYLITIVKIELIHLNFPDLLAPSLMLSNVLLDLLFDPVSLVQTLLILLKTQVPSEDRFPLCRSALPFRFPAELFHPA